MSNPLRLRQRAQRPLSIHRRHCSRQQKPSASKVNVCHATLKRERNNANGTTGRKRIVTS